MVVPRGTGGTLGTGTPHRRLTISRLLWACLAAVPFCGWGAPAARAQSLSDLRNLSLAQLGNIEVTSVLRRPVPLDQTPASVYVITAQDIRNSAAMTLPEVLRLAPNLEVAQLDARDWAISARGFNSVDSSNKLLVLVDGRSIYSILADNVYWDQLQVPLDDIQRIEVISGPGGAEWGANAFGGVINIITKNARDTQGGLLDLRGGPVDQLGFLQYGGRFGKNGFYRVYSQAEGIGHSVTPTGSSVDDGWHAAQTGFRVDWQHGPDAVLLEGDFFRNNDSMDGRQYGGDLTGRWARRFAGGSTLQVQTSFDQQSRVAPGSSDSYSSYDLQAQQTLPIGRHTFVYGGEYHLYSDDFINNSNIFVLLPARRVIGVGSLFAQDTVALGKRVNLTAGVKLEDSSYTGLSPLPSLRLGWRATDKAFFWAAVSRAVRTPSRIDRELQAPGFVLPALDFTSEKLTAFEIGYRGQPMRTVSASVSLYYNIYSDIRTTNVVSVQPFLAQLGNDRYGDGYGLEAWATVQVLPNWRLMLGANLMRQELKVRSGVITTADWQSVGDDPNYQLFVRSTITLPHNLRLTAGLRAIDALPNPPIPAYTEATARLGWQATKQLELFVAGTNLIGPYHAEAANPPDFLEPRRSVYVGLRRAF